MDILSTGFLLSLLSIILIDLVLAGDNAIVIGMAARNLKKESQKKVILWGTVGAIAIRAVATILVVELLKIPGLLLAGGILLLWISYKLLTDKKNHDNVSAKDNIWAAIRTIIIADAVMGMDNVIAVAGASHGSFLLVILGLLVSVPIVVWGSTLFIAWIEKYPWIIYIGAAVLVLTAGKMITGDNVTHGFFEGNPIAKWTFIGLLIVLVLAAGNWSKMIGYQVKVGHSGELTLPKELSEEAQIAEEDRYTVKMDARGNYVLVKEEDEDRPSGTMQHAG